MSHDPLLNQVLEERYLVERLIGEGAMGRVYLASHVHMHKHVAIKVLHRELSTIPEYLQRFEREAQAAAHIEHPHVAGATDFGKLPDGSVYLVLEYVEGRPLSELISEGPLELARVLDLGAQVASALQEAHRRGIVHRDLKPDNLLLLASEAADHVKVLDFGIAKVAPGANESSPSITQLGVVYGTPEYMAPEQALGQAVDERADIYALGVIVYEMLTGRRPYLGPSAGLLGQQLAHPLPKMSSVAKVRVPAAVEQLVVEMLSPDPKLRLPSAQEALRQIDALSLALTEGRLAGATGRSSTLLSTGLDEFTTRIERVTRNLGPPVKQAVNSRVSRAAVLAVGFGVLGLLGAVVLIRVLGTSNPAPETVRQEAAPLDIPPAIDEDLESVRRLDPAVEEALKSARAGGAAELASLAERYPSEGIVLAELALAYAKERRYEEALEAVDDALALDPKLNESPKMWGALFRAAQASKSRSATFRLLTGPMGAAGVGIIYDLARTEGVNEGTRYLANKNLSKEEVVKSAAPALQLVLALEKASTCEALLPLVERAASAADERALPVLKRLNAKKGCGDGSQECYGCLRKNGTLEHAIKSLETRAGLPP